VSDRVAVVLGARNLGGAVAGALIDAGWKVASVARSEDSLVSVAERGALPVPADAADPDSLERALARVQEELGPVELLVNAVSASRRREGIPFGGGPLGDQTLEDFRDWGVAVAEQAFVFVSVGARVLRDQGSGGTLVQVTGGSSRRAMPGRGSWSAGAFAQRALVQAAAQELRDDAIHAALLIVDATIDSPKTAPFTTGVPREALGDQDEIARAVLFLADQSERSWTHELTVTPRGDNWTP
jgi:NAD(P)-dependent dehydrogenase (short-subunit alcohol dehydrogenase family)